MIIPKNGLRPSPVPLPEPPHHSGPGIDLTDRRLTAALNVLVFTPYAVYLARGKRPPGWLVAASLGWLALQFADDLYYLVKGDDGGRDRLGSTPSRIGSPAAPPHPLSLHDAYRYRVNRT